jgi:hypothetical protein
VPEVYRRFQEIRKTLLEPRAESDMALALP